MSHTISFGDSDRLGALADLSVGAAPSAAQPLDSFVASPTSPGRGGGVAPFSVGKAAGAETALPPIVSDKVRIDMALEADTFHQRRLESDRVVHREDVNRLAAQRHFNPMDATRRQYSHGFKLRFRKWANNKDLTDEQIVGSLVEDKELREGNTAFTKHLTNRRVQAQDLPAIDKCRDAASCADIVNGIYARCDRPSELSTCTKVFDGLKMDTVYRSSRAACLPQCSKSFGTGSRVTRADCMRACGRQFVTHSVVSGLQKTPDLVDSTVRAVHAKDLREGTSNVPRKFTFEHRKDDIVEYDLRDGRRYNAMGVKDSTWTPEVEKRFAQVGLGVLKGASVSSTANTDCAASVAASMYADPRDMPVEPRMDERETFERQYLTCDYGADAASKGLGADYVACRVERTMNGQTGDGCACLLDADASNATDSTKAERAACA